MHEINTAHPFSAQSLLDKSRSDFLPVGWEASDTIRCADAVGIKAKYDGNIFAMIAAAFAEACEVKSALLRLMADQQKALLGMTRELTGYANDL